MREFPVGVGLYRLAARSIEGSLRDTRGAHEELDQDRLATPQGMETHPGLELTFTDIHSPDTHALATAETDLNNVRLCYRRKGLEASLPPSSVTRVAMSHVSVSQYYLSSNIQTSYDLFFNTRCPRTIPKGVLSQTGCNNLSHSHH